MCLGATVLLDGTLQTRSLQHWCLQNVLCWKAFHPNEPAGRAPLQPVVHSAKEDWWGVDARGQGVCDYDLLDFLPSNICFIYLTFGTEGPSSCFVCQGPILTSPHTACLWGVCLSLGLTIIAICQWPVIGFRFQIYTHTICQLSNLRTVSLLLKGKGRLKQHLSHLFLGGRNDMPFVAQINDRISTSVQANEINFS